MSVIAVDWGTSSLRVARLGDDGAPLEERSFPRGILHVPAGGFRSVLEDACDGWKLAASLVLISGMAGSRQGWVEAPYCECPADFGALAAHLAWVEPQRIAIVPGMSCRAHGVPDVMRGEETQVFGALGLLGRTEAKVVLPGTHSKWVEVKGGRIERFATSMTGEVYDLLRRHSIIARMLPAQDGDLDEDAFARGAAHGFSCGNLLHSAFSARTLALFGEVEAAALPSYLSGLVIAEELRSQPLDANTDEVIVVGAPALAQRYSRVLAMKGVRSAVVGAEATWQGLWKIAQSLEER